MYHMIVNPASKSGNGKKIWEEMIPILELFEVEYEVYFTAGLGDATEIVKKIESARNPLTTPRNEIIVLGGDGTLNEALQGIEDYEHSYLAYIPTGSSNDLARAMLPPKRGPLEQFLYILVTSHTVLLDIGRCRIGDSVRYFAVSSGIGFDASVCEEALHSPVKNVMNRLKIGKLTYLGIALKQLVRAKRVSCKLYLDDNEPITVNRLLFATAMIHRYEGGGFCFCPKANPIDGLLDICVIGDMPKLKMLFLLPTAFSGKHLRFKNIENYRAKNIRIETSSPLFIHTDGEVTIQSNEVEISCLKQRVQFFGF